MESQYRSILKSTSIFGGTQFFQMIIQIVRAKFVALLVGATGMGLSSIYMSSLTVVVTFFGMGICTSVVRDLSKANDENDDEKYATIIKVFNKMLYILSVLGTLFVICVSPLFSKWSFGNGEYYKEYCFLSLIVLFSLLSQGCNARMIGKRRVREIAVSTLYGSIATLLTSVPFFYFWGLDGVVPGLIVSTMSSYIIVWFYSRRVKLPVVSITWNDVKSYGISILSLGFTMVVASLLGNITVYLINICITHLGGIEDLGFFNAGMSITQNVISLVFAAMGADYYPRLIASMKDQCLMSNTINEQNEILVYLSVPILLVFSLFSPLIIRLLLSEEFLILNSFVKVLCFGMFFKVISYALGYVSFAKGDKIVYVLLEGTYSNLSNLLLSVIFYYYWGLQGIAYAFFVNYILYYLIIRFIDKYRYHYVCSKQNERVSLYGIVSMLVMYLIGVLMDGYAFYFSATAVTIMASYYNIKKLNQKTAFLSFFKVKINNILKH